MLKKDLFSKEKVEYYFQNNNLPIMLNYFKSLKKIFMLKNNKDEYLTKITNMHRRLFFVIKIYFCFLVEQYWWDGEAGWEGGVGEGGGGGGGRREAQEEGAREDVVRQWKGSENRTQKDQRRRTGWI